MAKRDAVVVCGNDVSGTLQRIKTGSGRYLGQRRQHGKRKNAGFEERVFDCGMNDAIFEWRLWQLETEDPSTWSDDNVKSKLSKIEDSIRPAYMARYVGAIDRRCQELHRLPPRMDGARHVAASDAGRKPASTDGTEGHMANEQPAAGATDGHGPVADVQPAADKDDSQGQEDGIMQDGVDAVTTKKAELADIRHSSGKRWSPAGDFALFQPPFDHVKLTQDEWSTLCGNPVFAGRSMEALKTRRRDILSGKTESLCGKAVIEDLIGSPSKKQRQLRGHWTKDEEALLFRKPFNRWRLTSKEIGKLTKLFPERSRMAVKRHRSDILNGSIVPLCPHELIDDLIDNRQMKESESGSAVTMPEAPASSEVAPIMAQEAPVQSEELQAIVADKATEGREGTNKTMDVPKYAYVIYLVDGDDSRPLAVTLDEDKIGMVIDIIAPAAGLDPNDKRISCNQYAII